MCRATTAPWLQTYAPKRRAQRRASCRLWQHDGCMAATEPKRNEWRCKDATNFLPIQVGFCQRCANVPDRLTILVSSNLVSIARLDGSSANQARAQLNSRKLKMKLNKLFAAVVVATASAFSFAQAIPPATLTHNTNIVVSNVTAATACSALFMIGGTSYTANGSYISGASTGSGSAPGQSINISCNGNQPVAWTASAGPGNHATGTTRRAATSGATPSYINYQLTRLTPGPSVFDAVTPNFGGTPATGSAAQTSNFYYNVDIPAGQTGLAAGTYTDSVAITVTF